MGRRQRPTLARSPASADSSNSPSRDRFRSQSGSTPSPQIPRTAAQSRSQRRSTLRWCSGSSRNTVRLPFGTSVQLHRNPHPSERCFNPSEAPLLRTTTKFFQQRPGLFEVLCIETFREITAILFEKGSRWIVLILQQP